MRAHALPRGQKGNLCKTTRAYKMRAHALPRGQKGNLCNKTRAYKMRAHRACITPGHKGILCNCL